MKLVKSIYAFDDLVAFGRSPVITGQTEQIGPVPKGAQVVAKRLCCIRCFTLIQEMGFERQLQSMSEKEMNRENVG